MKHVENVTKVFNLPAVVAINKLYTDTNVEFKLTKEKCQELGVNAALSEAWRKGSEGGIELAEEVLRVTETKSNVEFNYDLNMSIRDKTKTIAAKVYGSDSVEFSTKANREIDNFEKLGFGNLLICMAKN